MHTNTKALHSIYTDLQCATSLARCKQYAQWTIPAVFPQSDNVVQKEVLYDYQSIGAMLTHNLATKLTQLLFPTNTSFFKLNFKGIANLSQQEQEDLSTLELDAVHKLFERASYAKLVHAVTLLIITGNALLVRKAGNFQVYSLKNYVVRRDPYGKPNMVILRERVQCRDLSQEQRKAIQMLDARQDDVWLDLYTCCELRTVDGVSTWHEWQEINGVKVNTVDGVYPERLCPYICATWQLYTGHNYGRGHVELYAGDFIRLSELSAALGTYELESCNIKYLADPQVYTDLHSLVNSPQGAVVSGTPASVSALEAGQFQKIQALGQSITQLTQRLSQAFMYGVNQRDGERVTAYEIHVAAQQAEQALGGVYSQLSYALHLPLVYLLCLEANPEYGLPLATGDLDAEIVTGMPALGRSADLQQWLMLGQELGTLIPVLQQVSPRFNTERIVDVFMRAHGLSPHEVMYTGVELQRRLEELQRQSDAAQHQIRTINSQDAQSELIGQLSQQV